jgi:hypothetical protein
MLDLDMTEEAFGLTEFLRTTVYSRTGATERCIETLKREIALIKGEKFPLSALPWLVAAGGTKDSEVFWEIGAEMDDDGTIYCFGRDFPSLNRRFDVEVSGGADNSRLSHLSLVPNAPTRGRWQGKLPFSTGFLQLALRENSSPVPLLAPVTLLPVHNAPNLIRDDSFRSSILQFIDQSRPDRTGPMEEVIDGDVELRDAGPCPGRPTLRVSLTSGPHLIAGDLVRIEPGKSYFQSAWLRVKNFDNSSDWAEIGREYVDKDGAVLATTWMKSASQEQRWSLLGQYLLTRAATVPASDVIPEGTIFIRPVMEVKGTFEVGLLYLGETLD